MLYCRNCGAKLADKAKFCTMCGTSVMPKIIPIVEKDGKFVADISMPSEQFSVSIVDDTEEDVGFASLDAGETVIGSWGDVQSSQDETNNIIEPHSPQKKDSGKEKKFLGGLFSHRIWCLFHAMDVFSKE